MCKLKKDLLKELYNYKSTTFKNVMSEKRNRSFIYKIIKQTFRYKYFLNDINIYDDN